eukprot:CAMPEP_0113892120 /NCGR_PEP_ID=MMETSP0780_2-20120614/15209_1 /TAXON_ID=652834 /ORGANISM="Palpitomonas bilix" /LENGTH=80 /DNA_ID=CAMNT_0000881961 /DNA_START=147 /DNA_END=389 /DNA_ORIENTATION=- /assembly_acc=CAM_ASM_000599
MAGSVKVTGDTKTIKHLLDAKGAQYEEIDVANDKQAQEEMHAVSNTRVLPQLHVHGRYLGDVDEIREMNDFGELDPILKP